MKRRRGGFTLMEMLIVVALIGILAAVAIPVFTGSLDRSREAACAANRRSLKGLLSVTYMTEGRDAVADTYRDHGAEYTCPSGGKLSSSMEERTGVMTVSCTVHSSPDLTMIEIYTDYCSRFNDKDFQAELLQAVGKGGTNDMLRKYYYLQYGGWPTFQAGGTTLYVQPYVDAYGTDASHDVYLFANTNSGYGGNWNAAYFYYGGTWYQTKNAKTFQFANKGWADIQDQVEPMGEPPQISK